MKYSYYPGCTLKKKATELDKYARLSAKALGFELEEIENWQCCGGVYPLGADEIATKLSSVRALNDAKEKGQDLVTLCSACHHVIKRVNDDMKNVEDIRTRANNYMQLEEPYAGETTVLHFLEVLRDRVGFDNLKKAVTNPLKGKKIGAYYGCLLLRPGKVLGFDDPENPTIIEDFIRAIGAEPVVYPYRNECCGGYISLSEKDRAKKLCVIWQANPAVPLSKLSLFLINGILKLQKKLLPAKRKWTNTKILSAHIFSRFLLRTSV